MVIVTLMRRKHAGFTLETQEVEHRAFPNMKAAKNGLKQLMRKAEEKVLREDLLNWICQGMRR